MLLKEDNVRLQHMNDAAREAVSFLEGRSRNDLDNDRMLVLSLVKLIEIIGEAASRVTDITRQQYANIPWVNIIAMRNRLIHAYYDVDLNILWGTVTEDLPPLISALEEILSRKHS
jgi:uncharacterized protein with HEPN domain